MNETKHLAQFITETDYNDLSREVIEKAKELILDQLGCQLLFATMPWSKMVFKYIRGRKGAREESTVVNYGLRTIAEDAAFANAAFGHGFEMDDIEPHTVTHPGAVVIPAALASGEMEIISGKEFLTAVVIGYDVMIRIGMAVRRMIDRWFQTTGVAGTFGAAASACKVLGLNTSMVVNALAIAASESSGIGEYTESGGMVKRLHASFASQAGMRAALLAQTGLSGPPTALEGKKGFCQAFANEYSLKEITDGLGKEFRILWTGNKLHCCCAAQHTAIDAVAKILSVCNVVPENIEEIIVAGQRFIIAAVGSIIEPKDITGAQFSLPFGIALRLIKTGNGFKDYSEENLKNPDIIGLAKKVKCVVDDELDRLPADALSAKVTIKMKDGTVHTERVDYARGTIQNPVTKGELENKFRELTTTVLSNYQIEEIIQTIWGLEKQDTTHKLVSLLTYGGN